MEHLFIKILLQEEVVLNGEFDPQRVENAHLKRLLMINSYWYKLYLSTNLIAKGINA